MPKLCNACHEEPRMVSPKTGNELTMCAGCQKDYWANAKAAKAVHTTRVCKVCDMNKPATDFHKSGRICKSCHQTRQAIPKNTVAPDTVRTCVACKEAKPLTAFGWQGKGWQAICKPCFEARKAEQTRRAEARLPALPRLQFRGSNPLSDHVPPHATAIHAPLAADVLLIDRERGQAIRCQVLSEVAMDVKHMDHIVAFYAARGYRIVEMVEDTNAVEQTTEAVS